MFGGTYEHKVDAKGRVQIPSNLRQAGSGTVYSKFVLVVGPDGCLSLFVKEGRDSFENFSEAFESLLTGQGNVLAFMREFYSNIQDVEVDTQGRILVPKALREKAGIGDNVLIIGAGKWIDIWDKARYEKFRSESGVLYDQISRVFFTTLGRTKTGDKGDATAV